MRTDELGREKLSLRAGAGRTGLARGCTVGALRWMGVEIEGRFCISPPRGPRGEGVTGERCGMGLETFGEGVTGFGRAVGTLTLGAGRLNGRTGETDCLRGTVWEGRARSGLRAGSDCRWKLGEAAGVRILGEVLGRTGWTVPRGLVTDGVVALGVERPTSPREVPGRVTIGERVPGTTVRGASLLPAPGLAVFG